MALNAFWTEAVRLIPTAVAAVTSNRKTSAERRQQELLQQQAELERQAYDPNSALFKQQLAIETQSNKRNIAQMVDEMTRNQRRSSNMGRNPLLDPERADEVLSRYQARGDVEAAAAAQGQARQSILGMASGVGGQATSYGGMIKNQSDRMASRNSAVNQILTPIFNPQSGQSIFERFINGNNQQPAQVISQASPDAKKSPAEIMAEAELQKRSGGMNMANLNYNQQLQKSSTRANQGGRMFP